MVREQKTFCRICEAQCGLTVTVDTDEGGEEHITDIKPNRDHVVSQGYACIKGLKMAEFARSPDRLTQPLKMVDGEFVEISWDQALYEIGSKLKEIHARDGGDAIAFHTGNPISFSLWPAVLMEGFLKAFGSSKKILSQHPGLRQQICSGRADLWQPK